MFGTSKGKFLCLAACLLWALPLAAEQPPHAEIVTGHRIGVTSPMANYLATHHPAPNAPLRVFPLRKPTSHPGKGGGNGSGGGNTWTDPVLQTSTSNIGTSYTPGNGFAGITGDGYVPPDTNISVGENYIIETVNVNYAVYDRSGNPQQGNPAPIHAIFAAASGISSNSMCTSVDGGDPIVLYDKIDQRWIISQLAYNMGLSNNHFCLAISTSSDPTGSYAAYDFSFGKNFPDYPKLGIWTTGSLDDSSPQAGVYFSANIFAHGNTFVGAEMCGFPLSDVAKPPSSITMTCYQNGSSVFSVLPADLEASPYSTSGTTSAAPSGTPEYFMQFTGSNTLSLYQFTPNFTALTATVSSPTNITVAPFHEACGGGACVPQYNTSQQLDSLGDRLMYRLSYRNYGGSSPYPNPQSMVVTQSVQNSSASTQTGVRWYQLTSGNNATLASSWKLAQQGTFGPPSNTNGNEYRWMGSIAQDKFGDIGIGYSVSTPSMYPDIAFTGRTPADGTVSPSGGTERWELEPETLLGIGLGAQTSVNRWGDYSSMSVDPSNDCTMWYANEFLKSTGSYTNWGTYITSFKFSSCQ